jgi:hypothetical protein
VEKVIARKAFDAALQRDLEIIVQEAKERPNKSGKLRTCGNSKAGLLISADASTVRSITATLSCPLSSPHYSAKGPVSS